jgi:hypothetical protein
MVASRWRRLLCCGAVGGGRRKGESSLPFLFFSFSCVGGSLCSCLPRQINQFLTCMHDRFLPFSCMSTCIYKLVVHIFRVPAASFIVYVYAYTYIYTHTHMCIYTILVDIREKEYIYIYICMRIRRLGLTLTRAAF